MRHSFDTHTVYHLPSSRPKNLTCWHAQKTKFVCQTLGRRSGSRHALESLSLTRQPFVSKGRSFKRQRLGPICDRTIQEAIVEEDTGLESSISPGDMEGNVVKRILSDPGIEGNPLKQLKLQDAWWKAMKEQPIRSGPTVMRKRTMKLKQKLDFDVLVCGGTLGIFLATALQMRGHRVCIVEKNKLEGRTQEWNISRHELQNLLRVGVISANELEEAIATEFNPNRIAFTDRFEMWVEDVLNIGVSPRRLIEKMKQRFLAVGGIICEDVKFRSAEVYQDGVLAKVMGDLPPELAHKPVEPIRTSSPSKKSSQPNQVRDEISARLLIDCMGHWSPIVKQMRRTAKPDGICLVVGGCATGFSSDENSSGDFLRTITDGKDDMQLFWEAFPAEGGRARTTYMFTYCDAHRSRPSIEAMLERYFELLPEYIGKRLSDVKFKRVLFAGMPCYKSGPLQTSFDRVIQVGDASASASPLSFGGFGSMVRHLPRLSKALDEALQHNALSQEDLKRLQPYQPSLSAAWLFQRSMAFQVGQVKEKRGRRGKVSGSLPPDHVNRLLACNFRVMKFFGPLVLTPFLQDTIRWIPLTMAMNGMLFSDPIVIARVVGQLGPSLLLNWLKHYWSLALYTFLHYIAKPLQSVFKSFRFSRLKEAWTFGSGLDSSSQNEDLQNSTWTKSPPVVN